MEETNTICSITEQEADPLLLQRIWETELEIMDQINDFCRERKIKYTLGYGSLLGAIRHGGFIPWDDDLDIIMPREDYDQFKDLWRKEGPRGYVLQDKDTDTDYPNNFLKIRKAHTTFLQDESERLKKYHKGIFVDIFPADRLAPDHYTRMLQLGACMLNMLYTREYRSGKNGLYKAAESVLLLCPCRTREKTRKRTARYIQKWNGMNNRPYIVPVTVKSCHIVYPPETFDDLTEITFQERQYFITKQYQKLLEADYGDYMTLPPESERTWTHHPILIDFEHDYEELVHEGEDD